MRPRSTWIHWAYIGGFRGPPKWPKNGKKLPSKGKKMKNMDKNLSIRSILKLVLLPKHKTRGMTPYGAVEKNWGFSGGL